MVAREHDGLAAGGLRLLLELHQQVHDLAHVRAAVRVVAGLHEDGAAAGPVELLVDEPGATENRGQAVVRAVDVANGDHARGILRGQDGQTCESAE